MTKTIIPLGSLDEWTQAVNAIVVAETEHTKADPEFQAWAATQGDPWTYEDCVWKALPSRLTEIPDMPDRPAWVEQELFTVSFSEIDVARYGRAVEVPGMQLRLMSITIIQFTPDGPVLHANPVSVEPVMDSANKLPGTVHDWIADANADNLDALAEALTVLAAQLRDAESRPPLQGIAIDS
jgi:hypothetical protein